MRQTKVFSLLYCLIILLTGCQRYLNLATEKEETYFYSSEKEIKIGEALAREVERRFREDNDILLQQRINEIGQKLVNSCDRKEIPYYFKVLGDEKEINAFALPGGYVYVFRGLWDKVEKRDADIAAVLAHEIAHVTARHAIKRLQTSLGYGALAILVNAAPGMNPEARVKATLGISELLLSYSREEELEADRLAVRYLTRAGYEPAAMANVLKILQQTERQHPIGPRYLPTHPYITERLRVVGELINKGNISFEDYINTAQ